MDDVPAAQVLHPPRDVQHELQQSLQRQVLKDGHTGRVTLCSSNHFTSSNSICTFCVFSYKRMFSQSGQQQECVQVSMLHKRENHHRDRQPLARTPVKTHSYWTGHTVNQNQLSFDPGPVMCVTVCVLPMSWMTLAW